MNCEILETIYVRSNGDIPCDCDAGEKILLGRINTLDPSWNIQDILANNQYASIRKSLSANVPPWGNVCVSCAWFRSPEPFFDGLSRRQVRKIHIEPSLACNLECPCCSNKSQRETRPHPFLMEIGVFDVLLKSLVENSYAVGEVEYCGQGDPLMHPRIGDFLRRAREWYPQVRQRLITNGNFDYQEVLAGEFIDEIIISCDGVFQESYKKYRVGGNVERVFSFMTAIPKSVGGKKQNIVWKYILFEFNDSEDEIIEAQRRAQLLGINTLVFVFTHSRFKSVKYRPETLSSLPILFPNVTTNMTTQLLQLNREAGP